MQDAGPLSDLRKELVKAEALRFSKSELFRRGFLPASPSTIYRWLAGDVDPGLARLTATVKALRDFVGAERKRLAVGGVSKGGSLVANAEFGTIERGGRVVKLKEQEFKLFEAVRSARGPAYLDWIGDVTGMGKSSLHRAACMLRRKIQDLDFELVTIGGRGGEPPAYALSDRAGGTEAAS